MGRKILELLWGKKAGALYSKNRVNFDLPPKIKVSKKITDGRVGLRIKRTIKETPEISLRDLTSSLSSSLGPGALCPS